MCDNRQYCFAFAHVDEDPCPSVSKYLEIVYSCEQKGGLPLLHDSSFKIQPTCESSLTVCLHGLGVEDGNITNSQLSASSSLGLFTPANARLNGNSCWMPSGSRKYQLSSHAFK